LIQFDLARSSRLTAFFEMTGTGRFGFVSQKSLSGRDPHRGDSSIASGGLARRVIGLFTLPDSLFPPSVLAVLPKCAFPL
jgi:hypothetical protein